MLDFLVLSLPRSGSSWAANWLTGAGLLCLHDPLSDRTPEQLAGHALGGGIAAACTGLYLWPEWCARHARRVLILEREPQEVQQSLGCLGLPLLPQWVFDKFAAMPGRRVPYADLFDADLAPGLWEYLRPGVAFDAARHAMLANLRIEPHLGKWKPDGAVLDAVARSYRV